MSELENKRDKYKAEYVITEAAFEHEPLTSHLRDQLLTRIGREYTEKYAEETIHCAVEFYTGNPLTSGYDTRWFEDIYTAKEFRDSLSVNTKIEKRVRFTL